MSAKNFFCCQKLGNLSKPIVEGKVGEFQWSAMQVHPLLEVNDRWAKSIYFGKYLVHYLLESTFWTCILYNVMIKTAFQYSNSRKCLPMGFKYETTFIFLLLVVIERLIRLRGTSNGQRKVQYAWFGFLT